ncbi:S-methyl-5-thioribose-1-phosphate isomerase [Desulfoluna spongiiphila]|uniref:Methylthioribose-1-phosphate isomerase n=1 Tax=Desulfoluna spongiiphila TaxID=419481 RepID=A0A1G5JGB9_9BACT|nr:S-methyl-5-thioribose-1-phosphate isomerase [Desulfoluna spongiiphila]SCY86768.1 methylthioribose-1-phosphate isomerase [Desulfoluna spongiiphila]VVS93115.1 methylthioribose-1-phosphate isomerase [Desulfoluna spongiiphila]
MKVDGKEMRPIWLSSDNPLEVHVIDQRMLPHELVIAPLKDVDDTIHAIREMFVRGAPLIGATGAWGVYLACINAPGGQVTDAWVETEAKRLKASRPTAVNLAWAVDRMTARIAAVDGDGPRVRAAREEAAAITDEEAENCRLIGEFGVALIEEISRKKKGETVNILTHCNAGWLACVEYGTATAPIYEAYNRGIDVHVWVDETRPLNQGARLTAWELGKHGVKHTVIADNAGGHLMQHGMVDLVITGTDRTTWTGDVANKIGTYLKALAAQDNNIPFWVALPSSTFDWEMDDGVREIPIEVRNPDEIRYIQGKVDGKLVQVLVPPAGSACENHAFDVTPARLVTGFITERGLCEASGDGVLGLFPEKGKEASCR